jgi:chemotaxis protein MotB
MNDIDAAREVLIIKKRAPLDEGAAKGGVWKIAFADFMTAMMAFFLVMWLVNAANEETKVQVASYFNPVRLVDSKPQPRGLQEKTEESESDPEQARPGGVSEPGEKSPEHQSALPEASEPGSPAHEAAIMRDPMGTFERIAGAETSVRPSAEGLDPFAPAHWQTPEAQLQLKADSQLPPTEQAPVPAAYPAAPAGEPAEKLSAAGTGGAGAGKAAETIETLAAAIREAMVSGGEGLQPAVAVETTGEGILVSLTDSADFGMFAIASAEPGARTIALMDRLAAVLRDKDVRVVVRGHTDGRPFRSQVYDNWRLSTARAHMAAYMLERGGVDPARIIRIEGHADRRLKRPQAPEADENRRIELLVAPEDAP